jgi:hypothetical protein
VAPAQDVPITAEWLDEDDVDRRLLIDRWGRPSLAKDPKSGSKPINAPVRA